MARFIDHFIWGYQENFRVIHETHAKSLFQLLDKRLEPKVFLVGVLVDDYDDRYPACVEPENNFWILSESFNNILEQSKHFVKTYPESNILQSHHLAQQWQDECLFKRSIRDALYAVINQSPQRPGGIRYYLSYPVKINGYMVSLAIGLQEIVIQAYHNLLISQVNIHEYRSFKVPTSLIDAVIDKYLENAAEELLKPDPGCDLSGGKSPDEILRSAGNYLMGGIGAKVDIFMNQEGYEYLLFDAINKITSLKYEQAVSYGKLVLAKKEHPSLKKTLTFSDPIAIKNHRAVRKLLELASKDLAIHMNAKEIWGLVSVENYSGDAEDLYEVVILGYHYWTLNHAGNILMRVQNGLPSLPIPIVDENQLRTDISRIFNNIACENVELLISLILSAEKEKHGTTLIISHNAEKESQRLNNHAFTLHPVSLTPELLKQLTPIDGAVLLTPDGTCHAIGVILDGLATEKGDKTRGARYNSAVRYINPQKTPCMAIVFSVDGGISIIIPDLYKDATGS